MKLNNAKSLINDFIVNRHVCKNDPNKLDMSAYLAASDAAQRLLLSKFSASLDVYFDVDSMNILEKMIKESLIKNRVPKAHLEYCQGKAKSMIFDLMVINALMAINRGDRDAKEYSEQELKEVCSELYKRGEAFSLKMKQLRREMADTSEFKDDHKKEVFNQLFNTVLS